VAEQVRPSVGEACSRPRASELTRARARQARAAAEAARRADRVGGAAAVVERALLLGAVVCCPDCGQSTEKSDACMHMTCPCGSGFCYVCGGGQRDCPRGAGCDDPTAYIRRHPDWGHVGGEADCLVEFHRRKTKVQPWATMSF
jgi:hypothetical protein